MAKIILITLILLSGSLHAQTLQGDFNGDGEVGFADFLSFAGAFGQTGESVGQYDLDGSGAVDFADFLAFAGQFGKTTADIPVPLDPAESLPDAALTAARQVILDFGFDESLADALALSAGLDPSGYATRVIAPGHIQVAPGPPLGVGVEAAVILRWSGSEWVDMGQAEWGESGMIYLDTDVTPGNTYTYASVLVSSSEGYGFSPTYSITLDERALQNLDKTRVLAVMGTFADTETAYTAADLVSHFRIVEEIYEELSYGQASFDLSVIDLGRSDLLFQETSDISETLRFMFDAYQEAPDFVYGQPCDFDAILPAAQAKLDALDRENNIYGITIDSLHVGGARPYGCQQLGAGEILIRELGLSADVNLHHYDWLISVPYGPEGMGGAFNTSVADAGIAHGDGPITTIMEYVYSPYAPWSDRKLSYGHITDSEQPNERMQADQYTEGQSEVSRFVQTLAHELGHAFGIKTHSNGVDFWTPQEDADRVRQDPANAIPTLYLEYGNYFDLLGTSEYGIGMAPYYREFLGWLTEDRILALQNSQSGAAIGSINSSEGFAAARIAVTGGWIYVSYRAPNGFDQSLLLTELQGNTQGAIITYVLDSGFELSTSYLIDTTDSIIDNTFALLPGETFELYGVTLSNVRIEGDQLLFDVSM